ncbi:MAG: GNAT family N-acetyltransferase [Acidimicrobiales bacterium]
MAAPFREIATARLRLVPFDETTARAVLGGNLTGVRAAEGWPQEGTANGLTMALEHDEPPGWMITLGGKVIGDCGTKGSADGAGMVEIGYGLAAPFRGQGYGTEAVGGMAEWLLSQSGTVIVRASTLADNAASRRVLEKNGFSLTGYDPSGEAVYQRHA